MVSFSICSEKRDVIYNDLLQYFRIIISVSPSSTVYALKVRKGLLWVLTEQPAVMLTGLESPTAPVKAKIHLTTQNGIKTVQINCSHINLVYL